MRVLNLRTAALALVAGLGLGGCAYGPYGGVGVGVGYGNAGYYDPYYDGYGYGAGYGRYGYGAGYGYGYGSPYYGWYDGFYYPGSGYYVYDRYRRPHRWSDSQRRYWDWRRKRSHSSTSATTRTVQNWADFQNGPRASSNVVRRQDVTGGSGFRTRPVAEQQQVRAERQQVRAERQQARRSERSEAREDRFERRRGKKRPD